MKRKTTLSTEGMLKKQEKKCRLTININFLINIRCHAARVKALQLEVEGYFPTSRREKFLSWFIGDCVTSAWLQPFIVYFCLRRNVVDGDDDIAIRLPTHILTFSVVWMNKTLQIVISVALENRDKRSTY